MAKILFYGAFQALVGQTAIEHMVSDSSPLSIVLDELIDKIPELKPALFISNTEAIRPEVLLLHNGKLVRETLNRVLVHHDDEIVIMHQIAGG